MRNSAAEYLIHTVERHPERPAVSDGEKEWTFARLFREAARAARALEKRGTWNEPVPVYLPKSAEAVAAFAGILLSGNGYVPLDVKSPPPRIREILNTFPDAPLVSAGKHIDTLLGLGLGRERIIDVGSPPGESAGMETLLASARLRTGSVIDTDPVYIMHTSGSTGVPKGVVIPHRGVIDYIDWAMETIGILPEDVIGNQAPLYFDNSTLDIYLSWASGCRLHLIPEGKFTFPAVLLDDLEKEGVTFIFFVPSVLVGVSKLGLLEPGRLPKLTKVVFAGEVMPTKHLAYWQENLPGRIFINLYGPTEITVDCTYFVVDRVFGPGESLPIGRPCRNSDVLILDETGRRANPGEPGELCVRGSSLALGYWNDPAKTQAAFTQNPLNPHYPERIYRTGDIVTQDPGGDILFLGRKDSQIKHLGHRIELGEIDAAASGICSVDQCCTLYDHEKQEIVLFFEGDKSVQPREIALQLRSKLPTYMVPRRIEHRENLPTTPNGKIDRVRLGRELTA